MAITSVKKQEFVAGESNRGDQRDVTVPYVVRCDARPNYISEIETASAGGTTIPLRGAGYGGDTTRKCTNITVKPLDETGLTYLVTVKYTTVDPGWEENPLSRKDTVTFDCSKETESIFKSEDGDQPSRPIVTTAGEPYEKLPTRTTGGFKLVVEGYRTTFNAVEMATYLRPNAVNIAAFTVRGITVGKGEGKMVGGGAAIVTEGGVTCWKRRWEVELAPSWLLTLESRGFWEKQANGIFAPSYVPIVKGSPPQKVKKPWPLNEAGAALPNPDDEPAEQEFAIQPQLPFDVFSWTAAF